ncbi:MAG TPA: response regulator, partial [Candidatus Wallbacteria bacterium]|nr:response regulator [Candidatus Wallbacteria bacterium]
MLVEDNPGDVLLFKANLLEADFRSFDLSCAESFAAAIEMLKDRKFDLIFLDLSLPDAYGVETLIRMRNFVQNIPVIVITGLNDEQVWTRAIAAGAQDYLVKGQFDGATLVRSLRYSTERHHLLYELAMANIKLQSEIAGHIRTQESLQSEKDRLAITLRSIADGVIAVNKDMRVSLINLAAEEMTGVSSDEAAGKHIDEVLKIINTKTKEELVNPVRESISEGEIVGLGNNVMLKPNNRPEIYISAASSPIKDRGDNVIGAILVFSNISEQKKAEEELIKVSKLESLSLLASGIAHDFNNFLTGIIGNISMAKMLSDQNERIFKILTDAEAVSFQAKELTTQLLTFARGSAPDKKKVDLTELIKNSTNFMARGSNVRCEFNINPKLWYVEADVGQINQVVSNLVINAVQAMPDGGSIFVSAENVNLTN